MIRAMLFCCAMMFVAVASAQSVRDQLSGSWKNEGQQVEYHFQEDGHLEFVQNGMSVMVNEYSLEEGEELHKLVFTMSMGPQTMEIPALLKVVSKDEIWIEQFAPGVTLPDAFSEEAYKKHVLHRQEQD